MSGSFIYRHHVEPRVKLYSPREESFPIPLKYIDVTRTTHTNLVVKQENDASMIIGISIGQETGLIHGQGFKQFTPLEEKPPKRIYVVRGRLTRKQHTSRPGHLWPELWIKMGKNNARKLRGIYFNDLEVKEFKECSQEIGNINCSRYALQNYEEELWEWCIQQNKIQDLRAFRKLVNLQDCVWETRYHQITKTILQERE